MNIFHHSNQYHNGLRPKTKKSVMYIVYVTTLLLIAILAARAKVAEMDVKIISPLAVRAFAEDTVYKPVSINPDVSERDQNIALIKKIWGKDFWTGLQISRCEAGFRTLATNINTNGTVDQGLFQINSVHGIPSMDNAVANISYAYVMFKEQGFAPWSASKKCWNAVLAEK